MAPSTPSAWNLALSMLARRSRSREELRRRLVEKGVDQEGVESTLLRLEARGFVDDRQLAYNFARQRAEGTSDGPLKVLAQLKQRGVKDELAQAAVLEAYPPEVRAEALARALARAQRGFRRAAGEPVERLLRRMVRKGFDLSEVRRAIRDERMGEIDVVE